MQNYTSEMEKAAAAVVGRMLGRLGRVIRPTRIRNNAALNTVVSPQMLQGAKKVTVPEEVIQNALRRNKLDKSFKYGAIGAGAGEGAALASDYFDVPERIQSALGR